MVLNDAGTGGGRIDGARKLLEDLVAPSLGRLEGDVRHLAEASVQLSQGIEKNQSEILALWKHLGDSAASTSERIGRVEGKIDGAADLVAAKVWADLVDRIRNEPTIIAGGGSTPALPADGE